MSIFDIFTIKKKIDKPWEKDYTKEDLKYKIPNISIYDQVKALTKKYPNNEAVQYLGTKMNYTTFFNKIENASKGFKKLGIKKGDIITIFLPNIPEALICLYTLNKLGAIANMVYPLSVEEEIKFTLKETNSKLLIIYDASYDKIENFIKETKIKKVIFVSPTDSLNIIKRKFFNLSQLKKFKHHPKDKMYINYNKFYKCSKKQNYFKVEKFGKNEPCVILLHSGDTSETPKHVVIQNREFIIVLKQKK